MGWTDFMTEFIPDEDPEVPDEEHRRRISNWRKRLALVSCSNWMFTFPILTPFLVLALFSGIPILGRVAWSSELDTRIDQKVLMAVAPLVKEQKKLSDIQTQQGKILIALATASLREDICRYVARRLIETDTSERARLLDQISAMRDQYREYSGHEFNTADC